MWLCAKQQMEAVTTGSACALSRNWKLDRLSGRWRRCRSTPSSTTSSPLMGRHPGDPTAPPLPFPFPAGSSPSPSLDTGNHVTSGYESETSPREDRRGGSSPPMDRTSGSGGGSPSSDRRPVERRISPDSGHAEDLAASSTAGLESPRSAC